MTRFRYVLLALVALARILPHPYNITPVGALGLYAGARFPIRYVWWLPLAAMFLGDLVGSFYPPVVMLLVYLGLLPSVWIGRRLLTGSTSPARFAAAVMINAVLFYLVSNLSMVLVGYYPATFQGVVSCYVNGLPFLGWSIIGDAAYLGLMLGAEVLARRVSIAAGSPAV